MYRQIPLDTVIERDFLPQAVIGLSPYGFSEQRGLDFIEGSDDFDTFYGAAVLIEDKIPVVLKHYRGHPYNTVTMYLPAEITKVEEITSLLAFIAEKMWIPVEWFTWQRADDPTL